MSYEIGINTLNLKPTPRLAHTEYASHKALMAELARRAGKPGLSGYDLLDLDFCWCTNEGPVEWDTRGRVTDMGHAEFVENGADFRPVQPCPFQTIEEVLAFDAVKEYGLTDFQQLAAFYEKWYQDTQRANPNQVIPGGYYPTIVSGAIQTFGWDMLLLGASDRHGFERVLDSYYRLSMHHYKAWAETTIKAFICHDDMVWSQGAFMHPDFYRRVIFPRYRELWAVLKRKGIRVLFCSDADFSEFVDDIAEAGADGFIFEPMTALEPVVERYGKTHVIVSSKVDSRTLAFGTREQIKAEVDATVALAKDCPGFMAAVGNHIPCNVPLENALFYLDYLRERWRR